LNLDPGVETRLQAKAHAEGMPVENYLKRLIESSLTPIPLEEAIARYTSRSITQGQAAALAGVSRSEFITALGKAGISVFQYSAEEALEEAGLG